MPRLALVARTPRSRGLLAVVWLLGCGEAAGTTTPLPMAGASAGAASGAEAGSVGQAGSVSGGDLSTGGGAAAGANASAGLDGGGADNSGGGDAAGGEGGAAPVTQPPFDWVGVIGTGQSLSVGVTAGFISPTQPYGNLVLRDSGADPRYPLSGGNPEWSLEPLVEPLRPKSLGSGPGYTDGEYPNNVGGETPRPTTRTACGSCTRTTTRISKPSPGKRRTS
jgi:hypothetical protein